MNLIPIIANKLELREGEEFSLKGYEDETFKFGETMLLRYYQNKDLWEEAPCEILFGLVTNRYEVTIPPFNPKEGDLFWTYNWEWQPSMAIWSDDFDSILLKRAGCIFRTKEEAINSRPAKFFEITGKEWQE